jgi:hypothetical protein
MLATHNPSSAAPSHLLATPQSDLKLRVQGGEHHGRILRISAAKCSVGSAPGCTLRLRGEGIEPLHCLILSGKNGTIVRRNSPRTYLNGGPFEDASLNPGDILRVGPVELAVVACQQTARRVSPTPAAAPVEASYFEEAAKVELRIAEEVSRAREQEQVAQQRLASELCQMTEQLSIAREQLASEQRKSGGHIQEQISAEQVRHQRERTELIATQHKLQDSIAQLQLEVDAKRSELLVREQSTKNTTEQIHQLEIQLMNARQEAADRTAQRCVEQQQSQEAFSAVRGELEKSISRLTEQLQQREADLAAFHQHGGESAEILAKSLDDTRQELCELQVTLSQKEEQWNSYRSHAEEQLANLTTQLNDRDRQLAQRDGELAELKNRSVQLDAAHQIGMQLEEKLAEAAAIHQVEKENWLAEKNSLESQLADMQAARSEVENCRNQLEATCSRLEAQHCDMEAQLARAQEAAHSREDLERQFADSQNRLEQVTAQELAQQVAKEEAIRQYEEQVERWQSEAHKWQLQAEETAGQIGSMEHRCAQLELENGELRAVTAAAGLVEADRQDFVELRSQLELQRKELADAQARFQEEQALHKQHLIENSAREEILARYEAELRERETVWESARAEQSKLIEQRSQLIASQIDQFEAEQAAFARQQATIIQQMTTLEDRVLQLTSVNESRNTNSPFVIPRLDDPELIGDLERAEQPYVRARTSRSSEPSRNEEASLLNSLPELPSAELSQPVPTEEPAGDELELTECVAEVVNTSQGAVPEPEQENPLSAPSIGQVAEATRSEGLDDTRKKTDDPDSNGSAQASPQSDWKSSSVGNTEEDDSIEEYMNRLLSRVRGNDYVGNGASTPHPASGSSSADISAPEIAENPADPKEYVPRVHVPEPPERLSLMRALANTAATSAIHAHAKKAHKREIKRRSFVAILSVIGTISLFAAGYFTGSMTALIGSLAFMIACCVMIVQTISSSFQQVRRPPAAENLSPSDAEVSPVPEQSDKS